MLDILGTRDSLKKGLLPPVHVLLPQKRTTALEVPLDIRVNVRVLHLPQGLGRLKPLEGPFKPSLLLELAKVESSPRLFVLLGSRVYPTLNGVEVLRLQEFARRAEQILDNIQSQDLAVACRPALGFGGLNS